MRNKSSMIKNVFYGCKGAIFSGAFLLIFCSPTLSDEITAPLSNFDAQVRDTLLRNPEIILEVFELLESQQAAAASVADKDLIDQHVEPLFEGIPDDQPVLIEFVDYQCGYCRRAYTEVATLTETDQGIARLILQLPILGEASTQAAEIVLAVRAEYGDEAYIAAHEALMGGDTRLAQRPMLYVEETGYDAELIASLAASDAVQSEVAQVRRLAQALNVTGTPGFVTRTDIMRGFADAATLSSAVFRFEEQG